MRKSCLILMIFSFISFVACSNNSHVTNEVEVRESFLKSGSDDLNYIELTKIDDCIWVHTTYVDYNGNRTPSNGLVVITSKGLVLIDTPWNNSQTEELIKLTKSKFNRDFVTAIITHAHEDRIGGIDTLLENKIDVRSTNLTAREAEKNGFKKPNPKLDSDPEIKVGNTDFEIFYPGEGHSRDNITVWLPQYKVLFGGCIIKSMDSNSLGSTTDANVQEWPASLKKIIDKYTDAEIIIPGHGKWGSLDLVKHTLDLLVKK